MTDTPENNTPEPENSSEESPELETSSPNIGNSTINRPKRRGILSSANVAVAILLLGGVGYFAYRAFDANDLSASRLSGAPSMDTTPAGEQLAESERYQEALKSTNQEGAQQAQEQGGSFLATPDEPIRRVDPEAGEPVLRQRPVAPPNRPQPQQQVQYVTRAAPQPPQRDYRDIQNLAALMQGQANGLAKQWALSGTQATVVIEQDLYKTPEEREAERASRMAAANLGPTGLSGTAAITAGSIAFARTINGADTDTPGPVIAEIFRGPLKGARLIGQFQQNKNTLAMVVQFDRLIMPDGTEVQTSAYAIDGRQGSIAVKSDINHRWLQRYGPRLAGAFVAGLGQSLAQTGSEIVDLGIGTVGIVRDEPSLEDSLWAGAGQVGQQLASDIDDLAVDGPLVKLRAGYTIGVLFLENVVVPNNSIASDDR